MNYDIEIDMNYLISILMLLGFNILNATHARCTAYFELEKRTYQRPVKVLPSIPPQMTSTMTHHYDSSHDKLTSAINQRLLSSHEFIEDYSTINPHQSKCQLDIRLDAHFNLIPDSLPVHC